MVTESGIGTLVNKEVTSKLTSRSSGSTVMLDSILTKCEEFRTRDEVFPVYFRRTLAKYLETL